MKKNYPSLKRKIQGAMFQSSLASHIILACILLPILFTIIIPVGQIMTQGTAMELVQRYSMSDMNNKSPKTQILESELNQLSETEIINHIEVMNSTTDTSVTTAKDNLISLSEEFKSIPSIMIDRNSYDTKRLLILTSDQYTRSNTFLEKVLPFIKLYTLHFKLDNYEFNVPKISSNSATLHFVSDIVEHTKTTVPIKDMAGNELGYIEITINPQLVNFIVVPYILLIISVSFATLFIVSLLSKFMTKGLLKPITSVNKQLKSMVDGDLENISEIKLSVKKPPLEIHELLDSANQILIKMMDNHRLLEAQNEELHTQNDELIETKNIIQKQQNMLVQNEKMASVGQLSAAIVHEINTPVGAIKSNSQMIDMLYNQLKEKEMCAEAVKTAEKIKQLNSIILQASERVSSIIKSLKSYSRLDQSEFKASDINEDLQNVLLLTSNLWKNKINIIEEFGVIPEVKCYSGLLNQVFMNLIVNAIDAMENGGTLTLNTRQEEDHVVVSIQDTGSGISAENILHIFEEGFTTKSKHKGSGLGLSLSKDIVLKHNGRIEVSSELEVGSLFSVIIPIEPKLT